MFGTLVSATTSILASHSRAIVMVKASKHRNSNDTRRIGPPLEQACSRHALSDPLVRSRGVEIPKAILLEHLTEVPFAENNHVVETLATHAAEKSLANTRRAQVARALVVAGREPSAGVRCVAGSRAPTNQNASLANGDLQDHRVSQHTPLPGARSEGSPCAARTWRLPTPCARS